MISIRYAVSALALAGTLMASAQITLVDPGNVPVVGSSFQVKVGPWVAAGAGGEGQTYDFSAMEDTATNTYSWLAPSASPNAAMFPNATLMLVNNGPDTIFYQNIAGGLERVGESQLVSFIGQNYQVSAAYTDGILELNLPLGYNGSWTDADAASYAVNGNAASRSGMITGNANAYGTILIPGAADPIEVLRVTTHLEETNNLGFIAISHKRDVVSYFQLWGKFPVVRTVSDSVTSSGISQVSRFAEWLDPSALGIATVDADAFGLHVRPNPVGTVAEIAFDGGRHGALAMDVVDARGAVVLHRAVDGKGSDQVERFNVGDWKAGVYQVVLSAADGTRSTRRLVVSH
jgi:hypothetical protein